ncbi:trichohyalin [Trypanosoma rangeli]|uniref:Trichohyalin n=1 Tax=Trypanosoma rangeli TaxID=5698 RepID=A0A422MU25_TRYRA|nr:trichohyalin [Trypanosoma rangeli]RNE96693.1 trichohyalin [Trypanosoma rangeli]|eukprot:RNE96693.1 trichohyalin [Trypanosoma rangeli]
MQRASRTLWLLSGINSGRLRLAEQFATMQGWQAGEDTAFDAYVKEKRQKERYEAFDQRVERGYAAAAKLHKAEVQNAVKRRLKATGAKFTAATLREMKVALEERMVWLREVWTQIDADYRSGDTARQETAAREISAALMGEPSDYMQWVYEKKRELRFAGPIKRAEMQSELQSAELPDVSDEEVNRYHALRLNMMEVEQNVKAKYGLAGQQHWAELQAEKDDEYLKKLDDAAEVYKQLLDQNARLDESKRTELQRSHVERLHQAQVRFKAAMEMEKEREKLIEAYKTMKEERELKEKEQRRVLLQEAAEMRAKGKTNAEVIAALKERQLEINAQRQAEYELKEREEALQRKSRLVDMIAQFKHDVEEREGRELLQQQKRTADRPLNVFGFSDDDAVDGAELSVHGVEDAESALLVHSAKESNMTRGDSGSNSRSIARPLPHPQKNALWTAINEDTYEDPFHAVHQARLDAAKTYDPSYARTFPLNLVLGRKYSRQGAGEMAVGNETDRQILQKGNAVAMSFQWGIGSNTVHDLDAEGSTDYFMDGNFHVRDKNTGDIDWRYEKKKGGAIFKGPKFYRLGAQREAMDPGERSMDPMPYTKLPREHKWRSS